MTNDQIRGGRYILGIIACCIVFALCTIAVIAYGATTVTRQGGSADFACCEDADCKTPINPQYARDWSAKDACTALVEADGKVRYFRQWPMRIDRTGTAPPVTPPTQPNAKLVWSSSLTGTYADLSGATVSGAVAVRIANSAGSTTDCANIAAGPWKLYIDVANITDTTPPNFTESFCPYGFPDDASLTDTTKLINGSHTITAISGALRVPATFTVNNPAPPPVGTGTASLQWIAPTNNTDGSPLTDLAGYRICRGTNASTLNDCRAHNFPTSTSATWSGLAAGTHYFAVQAVNSKGYTSDPSNVAQVVTQ